jgi:hypothetical protein
MKLINTNPKFFMTTATPKFYCLASTSGPKLVKATGKMSEDGKFEVLVGKKLVFKTFGTEIFDDAATAEAATSQQLAKGYLATLRRKAKLERNMDIQGMEYPSLAVAQPDEEEDEDEEDEDEEDEEYTEE